MGEAILHPELRVRYSFILEYTGHCLIRINDRITSPVVDDNGLREFSGIGIVNAVSREWHGIKPSYKVYVETFQPISL